MPESGSLIAAGRKYPLSSTFAKAHAVRTCRRRLSGFATGTPPDARRFSAVDELALSASLRDLPVGERGWITLSEARALFSPMDDRYAFGEMDEVGKMSLAAFAAESNHRSAFELCQSRGGSTSPEKHLDPVCSPGQREELSFKIVPTPL